MKRAFKYGQTQLRAEVICFFWPVAINNSKMYIIINLMTFDFCFLLELWYKLCNPHASKSVFVGRGSQSNWICGLFNSYAKWRADKAIELYQVNIIVEIELWTMNYKLEGIAKTSKSDPMQECPTRRYYETCV